jgi:hypothetical protein
MAHSIRTSVGTIQIWRNKEDHNLGSEYFQGTGKLFAFKSNFSIPASHTKTICDMTYVFPFHSQGPLSSGLQSSEFQPGVLEDIYLLLHKARQLHFLNALARSTISEDIYNP